MNSMVEGWVFYSRSLLLCLFKRLSIYEIIEQDLHCLPRLCSQFKQLKDYSIRKSLSFQLVKFVIFPEASFLVHGKQLVPM